ncbi:hypothetical protein IMAU70092_02956 [Lactiplantibacillus plantarum]|nr:hypothetical protein [Lactiplantibacillus plantarum]
MSRIKSLFNIIKLKIIYNLAKKRSMILKLFPLLSALMKFLVRRFLLLDLVMENLILYVGSQ